MIQQCVVQARHAPPMRAFVKNGVDIYTCPSCGCIMADVGYAQDSYETGAYYTLAFKTKTEIEAHWGFRWRHILQTLQRYTARPSILDVGAGNGYFVYLARTEFGMPADGLEISETEAAFASRMFGLDLLRGDLGDVQREYDVVSSFNVIEHVAAPASLLAAMSEKLNARGYLIVTTPNPACVHRRIKGLKDWRMVHPPHHINLFTRTALSELVARAGFDVLRYSTISTYIRFARHLDTNGLLLRRAVFHMLKSAHLGADHLLICRKRAGRHGSTVVTEVQ
jgi:2-polyprenyl-3-methyl-5-hydroxy-6-metoxy-1,4-benzoquinol methylase